MGLNYSSVISGLMGLIQSSFKISKKSVSKPELQNQQLKLLFIHKGKTKFEHLILFDSH